MSRVFIKTKRLQNKDGMTFKKMAASQKRRCNNSKVTISCAQEIYLGSKVASCHNFLTESAKARSVVVVSVRYNGDETARNEGTADELACGSGICSGKC